MKPHTPLPPSHSPILSSLSVLNTQNPNLVFLIVLSPVDSIQYGTTSNSSSAHNSNTPLRRGYGGCRHPLRRWCRCLSAATPLRWRCEDPLLGDGPFGLPSHGSPRRGSHRRHAALTRRDVADRQPRGAGDSDTPVHPIQPRLGPRRAGHWALGGWDTDVGGVRGDGADDVLVGGELREGEYVGRGGAGDDGLSEAENGGHGGLRGAEDKGSWTGHSD